MYRLITRNSYEREMFDRCVNGYSLSLVQYNDHYVVMFYCRASMKLGLDRAVLQSMNSQNKDTSVVSKYSVLCLYCNTVCVHAYMCVHTRVHVCVCVCVHVCVREQLSE